MGARAHRHMGSADRIRRLDLPADPARERIAPPGRRAGIRGRVRRALHPPDPLPARTHEGNSDRARDHRARDQRGGVLETDAEGEMTAHAILLFSHGSVLCGSETNLLDLARAMESRGDAPIVEAGFLDYTEPRFETAL